MKPYAKINSTDYAKRKISTLSKLSGLGEQLILSVASITWDYDRDISPKESNGWVAGVELPKEAAEFVSNELGIVGNELPDCASMVSEIQNAVGNAQRQDIQQEFEYALEKASYWQLSRYSTINYLRGINSGVIRHLDQVVPTSLEELCRLIFMKIFRGGAIERDKIGYAWVDLCLNVPQEPRFPKATGNLAKLIRELCDLAPFVTISDLLKACKGALPGDKYYKQEVLQALSYAGIITVVGHEISRVFTPELKDHLAPHFYSNEWSYPLRFVSSDAKAVISA